MASDLHRPGYDRSPGHLEVLAAPALQGRPEFEARSPDGRWYCKGFLERDDSGRFLLRRVEIEPWTPGVNVDTNALRSLPLGRWVAQVAAMVSDEDLWGQTGLTPIAGGVAMLGRPLSETEAGRQLAKRVAAANRGIKLRRGRSGYPDAHYRRIALSYLEVQGNGAPPGGIRAELTRLENARRARSHQPQIQPETMRDWINRAGELGFLTTGRNRAAGPRLFEEDGK